MGLDVGFGGFKVSFFRFSSLFALITSSLDLN